MIFKDINCGFYVHRRPLQYACTHDEVAALAERSGIAARAIYNYDKGGVHAQDHLMDCMLARELITEMIELYRALSHKKDKEDGQ